MLGREGGLKRTNMLYTLLFWKYAETKSILCSHQACGVKFLIDDSWLPIAGPRLRELLIPRIRTRRTPSTTSIPMNPWLQRLDLSWIVMRSHSRKVSECIRGLHEQRYLYMIWNQKMMLYDFWDPLALTLWFMNYLNLCYPRENNSISPFEVALDFLADLISSSPSRIL